MPIHGKSDSYVRRIAASVGLGVLALVLAALLAPRVDPDAEWYEHTGIQGDLVLMDAIEIVTDVDPVTQTEAQSLPGATEGVSPPVADDILVDDALEPVPLEDEVGERLETPSPLDPTEEARLRAELVDEDRVRMTRPAQSSDDFTLLFAVSPAYPEGVPAALRKREIVVRVNLYVGTDGHVTDAYVDRNDGGPRFEASVLRAVRQWIYEPLQVNGVASEFWDQIYFVFAIDGESDGTSSDVKVRG